MEMDSAVERDSAVKMRKDKVEERANMEVDMAVKMGKDKVE